MPDYKKLVNALRCCIQNPPKTCVGCKYNIGNNECAARGMMCDAAAAIEALQAQLPKQGEWIWDDKRCIYVCSVCGSPKVRENMDRQIIKEQAYCYSCGAKMEVQDGE